MTSLIHTNPSSPLPCSKVTAWKQHIELEQQWISQRTPNTLDYFCNQNNNIASATLMKNSVLVTAPAGLVCEVSWVLKVLSHIADVESTTPFTSNIFFIYPAQEQALWDTNTSPGLRLLGPANKSAPHTKHYCKTEHGQMAVYDPHCQFVLCPTCCKAPQLHIARGTFNHSFHYLPPASPQN